MRILIFHGYLLRGTGSNVYNASLARALAGLGHEVHLLCQDRAAGRLDWVSDEPGPGKVKVYNPDIGRVLPVYVADEYEGFDAITYEKLSDDQLERVRSALLDGAEANGYATDVWTLARVAEVIERLMASPPAGAASRLGVKPWSTASALSARTPGQCRRRGSSKSRSASPAVLIARIVAAMTSAGHRT